MDLYDLIDPVELTAIARLEVADEDRPANQFQLGQWFPNVEVEDIYYQIERGTTRTFTDAMPFRAWTTENPLGRRPGRSRVTGEIPAAGIKYMLTEYDRIRQRAGQDQAAFAALLESDIYADIERGIRSFLISMEVLRAQLVVTGGLELPDLGLSVPSARSASNSVTVTTDWADKANGKPITDELALMETISDEQGFNPDDIIAVANRTTINTLLNSEEVRAALGAVNTPARISNGQLGDIRSTFSLPDLVEYNAKATGLDGVNGKLIPDNKVVYMPRAAAIGETVLGVPAMADEIQLAADERPGPVAWLGQTKDPLITYTVIDAIGLPALKDPDATFVLTTDAP